VIGDVSDGVMGKLFSNDRDLVGKSNDDPVVF
jgi:hypothetical protein